MQFKHPELLYALFLLIIPILIHLFQLRKFKKEAFTNLKFLQKISLQTRKSSQLKKWLVLCTRLLALAALILAFAQPFFVTSTEVLQEQETVIYLDNSYSMQASGNRGRLLQRSLQELLEHLPADKNFSLFTNNNTYKDIRLNTAREELQQITYAPRQMDFSELQLKAESEFSTSENTKKDFIVISDFQQKLGKPTIENSRFTSHFVKLEPENQNNVSIDSAFVENTAEGNLLSVQLSATRNLPEALPVSVYNEDQLVAKTSVSFSEDKKAVAEFSLTTENEFKGIIEIEDSNIQYDNRLYFSIQKPTSIKAVAINEANDAFLHRIFRQPDFSLTSFASNGVDFNALANANFVILNQLENIPPSIGNNILTLAENNVSVLIIPAQNSNLESYNAFLRSLELPLFTEKREQEKLITRIAYSHPLYEGVFDEQVNNFEYPKVQSFYNTSNAGTNILSYEDGRAFLLNSNKIFVFTAALDSENSNFKNSPLIVPTLFNIGKTALRTQQLYYFLGEENQIDVSINLRQDEILRISGGEASFIPQQQTFSNKVRLVMNEFPEKPGSFSILKNENSIGNLSFNVNRSESQMNYLELEETNNTRISNGIPQVLEDLEAANNINELWKWFVIFALLFLIVEMLILKFLK